MTKFETTQAILKKMRRLNGEGLEGKQRLGYLMAISEMIDIVIEVSMMSDDQFDAWAEVSTQEVL